MVYFYQLFLSPTDLALIFVFSPLVFTYTISAECGLMFFGDFDTIMHTYVTGKALVTD